MDVNKQQYQDIVINTCFICTLRGVAHTQHVVNRLLQIEGKDLLERVK